MNKNALFTVVLAVVALSLLTYVLFTHWVSLHTYEWNQQATIVVATNKEVWGDSVVQKVVWKRSILSLVCDLVPVCGSREGERWHMNIYGEAPHTSLPEGPVVVATLGGGMSAGFSHPLIDQKSPGVVVSSSDFEDAVRRVADEPSTVVQLNADSQSFPIVIGFKADDPKSGFKVGSQNASSAAAGIHTANIIVQKIENEVSAPHITEVLPWLENERVRQVQYKTTDQNGEERSVQIPKRFLVGEFE